MTVKNSFLFLIFASLTACKSYDITPGSERVRIFDAEPKGCLYVGEVSSVQEDSTVGTLETQMDLTTRVDLRNKAHALGGNILVFLKGKSTNTLPGTTSPKAKTATAPSASSKVGTESTAASDSETTTGPLVFIGTVFKCPASVLNQ